nr:CDP-glycerol glycerophosphotransferase family protein [Nitrospirota bacterium]
MKGCLLFAAVHMGPYQSLVPLEKAFEGIPVKLLVDGPARDTRRSAAGEYWDLRRIEATYDSMDRFMQGESVRAVIVGTSDGLPDGSVEDLAVRAATAAGITVFVIEDFPGNYRHRVDSRLDGLFVEDDLLRGVHSARGVPLDRIYCTGNPRYDVLRTLDQERIRADTRALLGLGAERAVFWAGQPDGDNSYLALERLMPHLSREGMVLLFKAHPRDTAYQQGRYGRMLSGAASIKDVTQEKDTIGLCCAADLVITQFSSVGVEAGYLDTPALYALFDDLGKAYVRRHKGYDMVPWAARECAFALDSSSDLRGIIDSALFDEAARARVRENFRRCYRARPPAGEAVAAVIRAVFEGSVA